MEREILKIQRVKGVTFRARAISTSKNLAVLCLGEGVLSGNGGWYR